MRHSWPTASQRRRRSTTPAAASACSPPGCSVAGPGRGTRRARIPGRRRSACWCGWTMTRTGSASAWRRTCQCARRSRVARAGAAGAGAVGRGRPGGRGPVAARLCSPWPPDPTSARAPAARHDLRTGVLAPSLAKRAPVIPASASPTRAAVPTHQVPARQVRPVSPRTDSRTAGKTPGFMRPKRNRCSTTSSNICSNPPEPFLTSTGR